MIEEVVIPRRSCPTQVEPGELEYWAVKRSLQTRVTTTLAISFSDGETIRVAGRGWVIAQDLRAGDTIRSVGRTLEVVSIEQGTVPEPVFNLEIDGAPTSFVGSSSLLVHDNTLPDPVDAGFDMIRL